MAGSQRANQPWHFPVVALAVCQIGISSAACDALAAAKYNGRSQYYVSL